MWLKATRGLKGPPPPSARVSDVLTACKEGRAPAAGSKWPLLRPSSRGRTELQSRRTQGRPPGPCVWGLLARAYPLRGARASPWRGALVWCARMAVRALHALGGCGRKVERGWENTPSRTRRSPCRDSGERSGAAVGPPLRPASQSEHSFDPGRGSLYLPGRCRP
jgi:hypothetical protein